ncbi:MAG: NAD(P)-dependent oxidoreductase [Mycobacteriales bacterium]
MDHRADHLGRRRLGDAAVTAVGFVGPGRMGRPMVDRLLQAGHEVTVLARREEVRTGLERAGARALTTPSEAAKGAEVVLVCLFSDEQLLEVCEAGLLAALEPGCVVASHVTGRRSTVQQLGARAAERGARFVDAPVSGGVAEIEAGGLTVMLGGDEAAVSTVDAVIAAYADPRIRTGALGSALAVKLVNNLLFATHAQTAAAAIQLGERLGVEQAALLQVLESASGRSFAGSSLGRAGSLSTWADLVGEFMRKDVAACEAELEAAGADGGLLVDVVRRGPLPLAR